jgi:GTPase SAR1 family protein
LNTANDAPEPLVRTTLHHELLQALDESVGYGILLVGQAGSGKTSVLRLLEKDLVGRGTPAFYVPFRLMREDADLGALVSDIVADSPFGAGVGGSREVRTSRGGVSMYETAQLLNRLGNPDHPAVLLLDGLDEAPLPERVTRNLVELTELLKGWRMVVTSRP